VFCQVNKDVEGLPELSQLTGYMRDHYEQLNGDKGDIEAAEAEFLLRQLFAVAKMQLGEGDEMGQRVLQSLLLEVLADLQISSQLFTDGLDLLVSSCTDLDGLMELLGPLIYELHELYDPKEPGELSLDSLSLAGTSEYRVLSQVRCLQMIMAAVRLPRVEIGEQVLSMLSDVIVPAVNSDYAAVQEEGLAALGLVCLLSEDLARQYLALFCDFACLTEPGTKGVRMVAVQALFDLFCHYGGGELFDSVLSTLSALLYDKEEELQGLAAEGFAKLMLHGLLPEAEQVLVGLFQLYFHPGTAGNPLLRQTLTYFFGAFAYSRAVNQSTVARTIVPVLEGLGDDGTAKVAAQLLELCDPSRLVEQAQAAAREGRNGHGEAGEHLVLAAMRYRGSSKGRIFLQALGKLHLDRGCDLRLLKRLLVLTGHLLRSLTNGASNSSALTPLKKLIALLVELDDPTEGLPAEELAELKEKMAPLIVTATAAAAAAAAQEPTKKKMPARKGKTTEMIEDLQELLDEEY